MTCIIVDDEPLAREGLASKIKKLGYPALVGSFHSGLEARSFIQKNEVDLIYLDIQMPDITGLDFFRTLEHPPLVIFTTAYSEYALEGFELDAIDYLLKPFEFQRFIKATNRAKEIFDLKNLPKHKVESIEKEFIFLRANREFVKVFFDDVYHIEGMKNYVRFHTSKGKIMTAISLVQIFEKLPQSQFARINKSYIINTKYIHKIVHDSVILENKTELPLGRTFQEHFIEKFVKGKLVVRE